MTSKVYLLFKVYYEGDGDLSFFSYGSLLWCADENSPISSAVSTRTELSSRKETVSGALLLSKSVQVKKVPMHASHASESRPCGEYSGIMYETDVFLFWFLFLRQMYFVVGQKGVFPSKLR